MTTKCKVCDQLETIDSARADKINTQILDRVISAPYAATLFNDVGVTTVKKHRSELHKDTRDELRPANVVEKHPKGWEPFSETVGDQIGSAIIKLPRPNSTANDLLVSAGFDPGEWQIDGPVNTRKWMRYDGEWLYYYKFDVKAGESQEARDVHVDELVELIRNRVGTKEVSYDYGSKYNPDDYFVVSLADWQIGKAHNGVGTPEAVKQIKKSLDAAYQHFLEMPQVRKVVLVGLGDLIESCFSSSYASQLFIVDLNLRDQLRITRELIYYAIDLFYEDAEITVACVGGNHGEVRNNREKVTDDADNYDCQVFESVKEAYDRAEQKDIKWIIPQHELSINIPLGPNNLGVTHGHLLKGGANPQAKARNWWTGQVFGCQEVKDSNILLTGHYHHLTVTDFGKRTHIQAPAMDCGSKQYTDVSGENAGTGLLTFVVTPRTPMGWDDLKVFWVGDNA